VRLVPEVVRLVPEVVRLVPEVGVTPDQVAIGAGLVGLCRQCLQSGSAACGHPDGARAARGLREENDALLTGQDVPLLKLVGLQT
jgi:ribulose 1,5-bisphosphate carboxylase large subunit-like protein